MRRKLRVGRQVNPTTKESFLQATMGARVPTERISRIDTKVKVDTSIYMKTTKLFRSGGSYAVRIPKAWVPASGEVVLRREGKQIIMEEKGRDLRKLGHRFAADGLLDFERIEQAETPPAKKV